MGVPFNQILVIDYETRYAQKPQAWCPDGYTLRKTTTEEYVRSPMFKDFGASVKQFKRDSAVAQWYQPDELRRVFKTYDWAKTAVVCHNAAFDASILAWHYGIQPAFIFDTLSMSRALRGTKGKNSLDALAKDFGLPEKGSAIGLSDGLWELPKHIERQLAEYCNHDVWLCEEVFKRFLCMHRTGFMDNSELPSNIYDPASWVYPIKELRLIDMTLRMFTRPLLVLDPEMLGDALEEEKDTREKLLARLGITDSDLASNDRFADILRGLGIEPPMKKKNPTVKTPNPVGFNYAFAKNDAGFQALLAHEDDNIVSLCEARLKVKSTTERTRAQRFLDISHRGTLPVPLHYYGAITGRWAAAKGAAINMQNLKRGSFLRKSIMAPEGHVIVVVDLSQIEPRVLAWLADYEELLEIFRSGQDAYAMFGAQMFNLPGLNKKDNPDLRQSAKSALLGAGYGLGWASFAAQLLVGFLGAPPVRYDVAFAKKLGVDAAYIEKFLGWDENLKQLAEIPHNCTKQELLVHCVASKKIIDVYRATASPVVGFWEMCTELIHSALADGQEYDHKGALLFRKEEIVLPNGMSIRYPNLRQEVDIEAAERGIKRKQWVYGDGAETTKLYAGKVTNNCLAQGTEVLTDRGWICIEDVRKEDAVHDGVEFVYHAGLVANGVQACTVVDGVQMTPGHYVLTSKGWARASQVQEPYRPDLRHVDSVKPGVFGRQVLEMALPVRVRSAVFEDGAGRDQGPKERTHAELRVHDAGVYSQGQVDPRDVEAPRVYCLEKYDVALLQRVVTRVRELWRAGHSRLQTLAPFRSLLGGHGAYVRVGAYAGARKQRARVQSEELCVGNAHRAGAEPAHHLAQRQRAEAECGDRNISQHTVHALEGGVASRPADTQALVYKQVYDIMNCGPRSRFVVRGVQGPFIVHNCTQALARIVMTDGMLKVGTRMPVCATVHDEAITLARKEEGEKALGWMIRRMTEEPKYMPGIPLAADGGFHRRYGVAKN